MILIEIETDIRGAEAAARVAAEHLVAGLGDQADPGEYAIVTIKDDDGETIDVYQLDQDEEDQRP